MKIIAALIGLMGVMVAAVAGYNQREHFWLSAFICVLGCQLAMIGFMRWGRLAEREDVAKAKVKEETS